MTEQTPTARPAPPTHPVHPARNPNPAAAMLRLSSWPARAILVMCLLADVLLAVANLDHVRSVPLAAVPLLLIAAASVAVTWPAPSGIPTRRVVLVLALTTATVIVGDINMPNDRFPGYASWHFGAVTLVLITLALWNRFGAAWIGFALTVGITVLWTVTIGGGSTWLVGLLPNQTGSLVVGSLFALGLRRQSRRIDELHAQEAALASAEAAARASAAERERQSVHLNEIARPALVRIAGDVAYSEEERDGWLRLEATIRDGLRARALDSPELADAATNARERGVEVTLLDDSAGTLTDEGDRREITEALIAHLDEMSSGRLIGRVLPPGRGSIATILVDEAGGGSRQVDVEARD